MRKKAVLVVGLIVLLSLLVVSVAVAAGGGDLKKVRRANQQYQRVAAAQAAGYNLVPGLDHCFDNPGVGAMGYHYINTGRLDLTLEALHPEALVYAPQPDGKLKLAAVEYIVPAAEWDAAGHPMPPQVLGRHLHLNSDLGVYVLHAWLWKGNPNGVFEDWNPTVSCP